MKNLLKALGEDILIKIPEIKKFHNQWPSGQEALDMPCISLVTVGKPIITKRFPTRISETALEGNKVVSRYITGQWEHNIQLDLWCEYKETREKLLMQIVDYFDSQFKESAGPQGLRLVIPEYFDSIASYILTGYTNLDSEDSSKLSEFRVKFDIIADSPKITEREEYLMKQFIVKNRVDEFVDIDNDVTNEEKIF